MLSFSEPQPSRRCDGLSRRTFLRVGSLPFFGLGLAEALASRAVARDAQDELSCILLWCDGGISTVDTFDMKPAAPVEYRGEFKPISTSVPGLTVCEHLPQVARQMHRIGQCRTIEHTGSQHAEACHFMLTGWPQVPDVNAQPVGSVVHPCYGSVVAEQLGWRNDLPPFVQLSRGGIKYHHAGYLGSALDPLKIPGDPNRDDFRVEDVSLPSGISSDRLTRRRSMIDQLDEFHRLTEQGAGDVAARNQFYQQAFDLVTSPAAKKAFQLAEESDQLRDRYGRHREGQATLLARRLVEAGVRFVTVEFNGYDTHDKNFIELRDPLLPKLDVAYSALLEDLDDRGRLENTLVICMGEFGRTPKVNGLAGRDHYPKVNSICFSGAGLKMDGFVHGRTSDKCEHVVGATNSTHDLAATIFQTLHVDHTKEYHNVDSRPILTTDNGRPINEMFA
ncbi:MAG: DUF1501 domain-containing protein [Planctomycetota bacterium]|nr:MAG: DUF1501 domain-containing protein [Planctomycetota bacterium]REJ94894.1 MAG: DUF1501 domain-containing protein [Planctomycetota bacterium]REK27284.1 MAG: DUF1501 domain-containing protein [Planctomycetota bacterium]REK36695.1 MAG: DUF1501 domain-containing protein [Planctomycetota bacterium]